MQTPTPRARARPSNWPSRPQRICIPDRGPGGAGAGSGSCRPGNCESRAPGVHSRGQGSMCIRAAAHANSGRTHAQIDIKAGPRILIPERGSWRPALRNAAPRRGPNHPRANSAAREAHVAMGGIALYLIIPPLRCMHLPAHAVPVTEAPARFGLADSAAGAPRPGPC